MESTFASKQPPIRLPPMIRGVWIFILVLVTVSISLSAIAFRLHADPVYYRVLSSPGEHFSDFTIYRTNFLLFHTAAFYKQSFPFTYPAPVALVYEFFFRLFSAYAVPAFVTFSIIAVVVPAALFGQALTRRGLRPAVAVGFSATLLLFSWPALLVIDRGNMEVVVWIALALATWTFATGREYLAASFFGVAAALKLFPFVFLALFLSTRRYRMLAVGIAVFLCVSIVALAVLGPSVPIAAHGIVDGLRFFRDNYMAKLRGENGVDHSIFATIKGLLVHPFRHPAHGTFNRWLLAYTAVTVLGGTALYFWRIRFLPHLNQLLILSIVSIYFTAFSGDGTLLHLYYPFAALVFLSMDADRRKLAVPGLQAALYLLAFLVTYESFFVSWHQRLEGQVKCLALGGLLIVAHRYRFGPKLTDSSASSMAWPDASVVERP